ncbi:MAG: protocatechuate 3,4-dioxygenase subunit alpha [Acidobacteriales bacterium]|nr:protocatechuate 3,4-dioxygenase subunit alpha [Terriglobales bacterium]
MNISLTPSQTVGPFFNFCLTAGKNCVSTIAGPEAKGERVHLTCRVFDGDGLPLDDAMIEIWQADAAGKYKHPDDPRAGTADPACSGFGRMGTRRDGSCEFETIKPGRVPGPHNSLQAPHLNLAVFGRGLLKQLYTRVYFFGDAGNQEDPVLNLVPKNRRETLMALLSSDGRWRFDIHLQGETETVFFDV